MPNDIPLTVSPVTTRSTSGAGFAFEDLVAADLLSQFLLDSPIAGIDVPGCYLLSQTAAAGWLIDDLLCVGRDADGLEHRLALSCKSNVQVTGNGWPAEFISAAWRLWRQDQPFRRTTDRIGLVTRGRHAGFDAIWSDLKSWCTDADPELAMARINATATHRRVFDSVRIPGENGGELPSEADTIRLIIAVEIYPLDFQLSPSTSQALAKRRCRMALVSEDAEEADELWTELVKSAERARLGNGINRVADLIQDLSPRFGLKAHPSIAGSWTRLLALSANHLAGIERTLPNGYAVTRPREVERIVQALVNAPGCLVVGDSGAGKSALVSDALDANFAGQPQIWLGPQALAASLNEAGRQAIGLDHPLSMVVERSPGAGKVLVLDSIERLDSADIVKLDRLLADLAFRFAEGDQSWRVIVVSQLAGFEDQGRRIASTANWKQVAVPVLSNSDVRGALASVPALAWISTDAEVLPLLANLQTLAWVVAAASSFREGAGAPLTSTAAIADRLWAVWTAGPAQVQLRGLLMKLAVRDAAFERSFAVSELDSGDLAAFDKRSTELPLVVSVRNRIGFKHDLASDWARYQRLKEIADDIPKWAALATEPLWIGAIRLFGQYLLDQPDQAAHGWDNAFQKLSEGRRVDASDLLLDALCLDQRLDHHLTQRAEKFFADDGALLLRLMHRFFHVATAPSIPDHVAIGDGLRIYLEAEMRFPIPARWAPMGRFLAGHSDRVGALGAPIVAKICKAWLTCLPSMLGDKPMPLRDVMARVALETARTRQVQSIASRTWGGGGDDGKLIYTAALAGAGDLPAEIGGFALEMARRRPLAEAAQSRVDAIRAADRLRRPAQAQQRRQRSRALAATFISSEEDLPPWSLGPEGRLLAAFRDAVLHANGLTALMQAEPSVATEVLLACMVDDHPTREYGRSMRLEDYLGMESDQESYPTVFWKSPFFVYLPTRPDAALAALKQLLEFAMDRWAAEAPRGATIPAIDVAFANGVTTTFRGTGNQFCWSQHNSTSSGQLFCALDALERWLVLKADAGEDLAPWCERLFALGASTAIIGVLVNLGKYQPALFKGALKPLVGLEALYWWDANRVDHVGFNFNTFYWSRQGDQIFNMARDWVLAPHRRSELRTIIGDLATEDKAFAAQVIELSAAWPIPEDLKQLLEQRVLRSEFDPDNRQPVADEATGETAIRLVYPLALRRDLIDYQRAADAKLEPLTLPHRCEQVLAGSAELTDDAALYLAGHLPDGEGRLPIEADRRNMVAAAAATLIARGGDWFRQRPEVAERAHHVVRSVIARASDPSLRTDEIDTDEALRFAAIGALYAAMAARDPHSWNAPLAAVISGPDRGALQTLMRVAERHRDRLNSAWYRMNFMLVLFAGLNRLKPRFEEDMAIAPGWSGWLERLRSQPIFGTDATLSIIDAAGIARRVERLLQRRRERLRPDRPSLLKGKSRRFAGLSTQILESGFAWLLDYEVADAMAAVPENHRLLFQLWAFEAWRMQGDEDESFDAFDDEDDSEYDLPSGMGYSILRIAATFVMAAPAEEPEPLWRAILAIGPNGYHAVEQFASGWFFRLYSRPEPEQFMKVWKAMLATAFAADWRSGRRWYRGRDMLEKLLGLNAPIELSGNADIADRIPELTDYFRMWAQNDMSGSEEEVATFCHFLTTYAGQSLRLEGVIWLNAALAGTEKFYRGSTGNNVAEAIDTILTQHPADLIAQSASRNAVIEIVAKLVRGQVVTAMGLQRRLAALR